MLKNLFKPIPILFLVAIIIVFITYLKHTDNGKIITSAEIEKMVLAYSVGENNISVTDKNEIEDIINQINSLEYKTTKWDYQAAPDIFIAFTSEDGNVIFLFNMYKIQDNIYCYYIKNGKSTPYYYVDGENLFNLVVNTLEKNGIFSPISL